MKYKSLLPLSFFLINFYFTTAQVKTYRFVHRESGKEPSVIFVECDADMMATKYFFQIPSSSEKVEMIFIENSSPNEEGYNILVDPETQDVWKADQSWGMAGVIYGPNDSMMEFIPEYEFVKKDIKIYSFSPPMPGVYFYADKNITWPVAVAHDLVECEEVGGTNTWNCKNVILPGKQGRYKISANYSTRKLILTTPDGKKIILKSKHKN